MRFGIRDLLWLTVVAAVSVCWFINRRSVAKIKASLESERSAVAAEWKAAKQEGEHWIEWSKSTQKLMEQNDEKRRPIYYPPKSKDS